VAGKVNYFVGRSILEDAFSKYKYPNCNRDIIPNELYVNMEDPVIICEGIFDVIAIKRNVIPLLGKEVQPELMKKILSAKCKKIYLALDPDALKQLLKYAEIFMKEGKQVFLVDFSGYDPGDGEKVDPGKMGFVEFTKCVQKATRLTQGKLMKMKINM
jgi:DNA primase